MKGLKKVSQKILLRELPGMYWGVGRRRGWRFEHELSNKLLEEVITILSVRAVEKKVGEGGSSGKKREWERHRLEGGPTGLNRSLITCGK